MIILTGDSDCSNFIIVSVGDCISRSGADSGRFGLRHNNYVNPANNLLGDGDILNCGGRGGRYILDGLGTKVGTTGRGYRLFRASKGIGPKSKEHENRLERNHGLCDVAQDKIP